MVQFNNSWDILLKDEFKKPYYLNLRKFLVQEYKTQTIYPDMNNIFNALKYTDYKDVKVVILGQDPYHQPNQAHGLCFSVLKGVNPPPSLQNMYKEIHTEYGYPIPQHGELTYWAEQGVLMMNTVLTVRESQPNSHKGMGWEIFTDNVITLLNARPEPMVFLLWGANARAKKKLITKAWQYIEEDSADGRLTKCKLLGRNLRNAPSSDVEEFLYNKAGENPQRIIELYTSADVALQLLLIDAREKGTIKKVNGMWMYGEDTTLGATDESIMLWFKIPENKAVLELIRNETYPEYMVVKKGK